MTSLDRDRDRYVTVDDPQIRSPDIIIVSGDIVQGVWPGTLNSNNLLAKQYAEAIEFLKELTDRFVDGDKSRVVIVPGNHDVDACKFMQSVERVVVQSDKKKDIVGSLFSATLRMRWSWQDLEPFEIIDEDEYANRLSFCEIL